MSNPYSGRPPYAFWKEAVADCPASAFDPVVAAPFEIGRSQRVATAGSCFAQHIAKTLAKQGFNYHVTEAFDPASSVADENYGVFPARFGNVYTVRQLMQLFDRAFDRFTPQEDWWAG